EFLMGDFGPLVGEKLPFSINQDDKVLHKVVFLCRLVWNEL
ncbi:TPA: sulfatase modifying factor 1, partial [Klebsiella pneumoniae]|nr:sulfatase modifying factor 1 [Klebsiella pneumoniae]